MGRLTALRLTNCSVGPSGAFDLANAAGLARLTELDLHGCDVDVLGLEMLLTSPHWPARLTRLGISACVTQPAAAEVVVRMLADSPRLATVTELVLGVPLTRRTAMTLRASPHLKRLVRLHLVGEVDEALLPLLVRAPGLPRLRELTVVRGERGLNLLPGLRRRAADMG
jgi:hypothetical protein